MGADDEAFGAFGIRARPAPFEGVDTRQSPFERMVTVRQSERRTEVTRDPLETAPLHLLRTYLKDLRAQGPEGERAHHATLRLVLYPPPGLVISQERRLALMDLMGVPDEGGPLYLRMLVPRLALPWQAPDMMRRVALAQLEIDAIADPVARFAARSTLLDRILVGIDDEDEQLTPDAIILYQPDPAAGEPQELPALSVVGPPLRETLERLVRDVHRVSEEEGESTFRSLWWLFGKTGWLQALQGDVGLGPDLSHLPVDLLRSERCRFSDPLYDLQLMYSHLRGIPAYRTLRFRLTVRLGSERYMVGVHCARNAAWSLQEELVADLDARGRHEEATERLLSLRPSKRRDALMAARADLGYGPRPG
jgi:hypothetical protein